MASARQVFAERGYEGASITDIAKLANVAVGSVYGHFATKQELFWAVLNERLEQERSNIGSATGIDPKEFIKLYSARLAEVADSGQEIAFQAEIWLHAMRDESFRAEMLQQQRKISEMVAGLAGQLRADPDREWLLTDEEVAVVATALYRGLSQARRVDRSSVSDQLYGKCMLPLLTLEVGQDVSGR